MIFCASLSLSLSLSLFLAIYLLFDGFVSSFLIDEFLYEDQRKEF
jgi:hypothetical protein